MSTEYLATINTPDFFVLKTEDGEIRIYKTEQEAKDMCDWYLKYLLNYEGEFSIKGRRFGQEI